MNILILFDFFKLSALKYLHLILFVIANCFNLLGQVSPYQSGAYLPGISGVRDLTYPEFEGLTLIDYNLGLWANKLTDHNGDPLKINQVIPGFEDSEISVKGDTGANAAAGAESESMFAIGSNVAEPLYSS